jgi:two-component system response regulator NreC
MIRLLICDDAPDARKVLRTILSDDREISIVGEARDGSEAIALALDLEPDVILMDVSMPVVDGIEATQKIRELLPSTRIVAFAGSDDLEVVDAMIEAGASAYCLKGAPLWELERAIAGASGPVARELVDLSGALCAAT